MIPRTAACAFLAAGLLGACTTQAASSRVVELLGGPESVRMLLAPAPGATVEAWRIVHPSKLEPADLADARRLDRDIYVVLSGPVAVDAQLAAELARVLTDDDTYRWDSAKACEFDPGVALRWSEGARTVGVKLCFSCDELWISGGTGGGREDFDARRADLVRAVKRLFPEDAEIQALSERG